MFPGITGQSKEIVLKSFNRDSRFRRVFLFLFVGGIAFLVDAAAFNILVYWGGQGPLFDFPLPAKVAAVLCATVVTYIGNKALTYRHRRTRTSIRQILIFSGLNIVAILLQLGCLGFSRYVLGLADPVADNLWGTFIGQTLATVFRYVTYGRWVFPENRVAAA